MKKKYICVDSLCRTFGIDIVCLEKGHAKFFEPNEKNLATSH